VAGSAPTRQRSFRLSEQTLAELGARAQERGESANSLAARLIEEGLRTDRHPLIWFREGAGVRRPALLGTRLDVAQVVAYLQANDDDPAEVADLLAIPEHLVHAAASYSAEFGEEIDAWLAAEADYARRAEPRSHSG
jgi:uncharacterized protein (DUF433 family)